jgi:hypothetical protein
LVVGKSKALSAFGRRQERCQPLIVGRSSVMSVPDEEQ